MDIIFRSNTGSSQSGILGVIHSGWDPDETYPENEYVNAYFRIDTPAYRSPYSEAGLMKFDTEVTGIFVSRGWTVEEARYNGVCTTVRSGKSSLYLHPQNITGEIPKNGVKAIAEALEGHETFSLECVDLYETVYDLTDEAYYAYLREQKDKIRLEILTASQTPRRDQFWREYSIACTVASKVGLKRVGEDDACNGGAGKTANFVAGLIPQLIDEGYLVSATGRDGSRMIRTINKTEQRQRKLKIA